MANSVIVTYRQAQLSGTGGNIWAKQGSLAGIFVSTASSSPTITVYDDAAAGTAVTLVPQFVPAAGTYYPLPFQVSNGINIVIGGTVTGVAGFVPGLPFNNL